MSTPNTYLNADTGLPDPAVTRVAEVPKPDPQQVPSAESYDVSGPHGSFAG